MQKKAVRKPLGLSETLTKFSWAKQPNGCYTIYDVPIFGICEKASMLDLKEMQGVANEYEKRSVFPRVHLGHHENACVEKVGAGFLRHVWLDVANRVLRSDIVEIPPQIFAEMYEFKKYPYCSIQKRGNEIETLALLESQRPFFNFPALVLKEEGEQYSRKRFFGAKNMDENIGDLKIKPVGEEIQNPQDVKKPEEFQKESGDMSEIKAQLAEICAGIKALLKHEKSENFEKDEQEESDEEEPKSEKSDDEPVTIAYSRAMKEIASLRADMKALQEQNTRSQKETKAVSEYKEALEKYCRASNVDVVQVDKSLAKLPVEHRVTALQILESSGSVVGSPSPMSEFGRSMLAQVQSSKVLEKYSRESFQVQAIAKRAEQDYRDTISQPNEKFARAFSAVWDTCEKYVENAVQGEKVNPGYYAKTFLAQN